MNFTNVYNVVFKEYSHSIAILVVSAISINLSMKVKDKDLTVPGRYVERLNKKTKEILWTHADEFNIDLVIKIRDAYHEYSNRVAMNGLGGCEIKTLRQIVEKMSETKTS